MARERIRLLVALGLALLVLFGLSWLIIPRLNRGSLVMNARIIQGSGEMRPIAGETFYLLNADLILLPMEKGEESSPLRKKVYQEHPNLGMVAMVMDARRRNAYSLGAEVLPFIEQSRPLWERHVITSLKTDAHGNGVFKNLKPGDYWLMGRTDTGAGAAFWNQRVSVERGENKIMLDEGNALYVR
jgi:hypothetical protein